MWTVTHERSGISVQPDHAKWFGDLSPDSINILIFSELRCSLAGPGLQNEVQVIALYQAQLPLSDLPWCNYPKPLQPPPAKMICDAQTPPAKSAPGAASADEEKDANNTGQEDDHNQPIKKATFDGAAASVPTAASSTAGPAASSPQTIAQKKEATDQSFKPKRREVAS